MTGVVADYLFGGPGSNITDVATHKRVWPC